MEAAYRAADALADWLIKRRRDMDIIL